jgi:hypothetical protein
MEDWKMQKKLLFLLAVLALVVPAQAITWDYVYEADALPTSPWTMSTHGGGVYATMGTDAGTTYMNIDSFNTSATGGYVELAGAITDLETVGVVIESRLRVFDDSKQCGGVIFRDGSQGAGFNFYCDSTHNNFSIPMTAGGNWYGAIPAPDPTEWHTYRIEAFGNSWELYVDDVKTWWDDLFVNTNAGLVGFGDRTGAGNDCDIDFDYIRIANIPEPMTLLLLAGGGLLGLRRRRS